MYGSDSDDDDYDEYDNIYFDSYSDESDEDDLFDVDVDFNDPDNDLFYELAELIVQGTSTVENELEPILEEHPGLFIRQSPQTLDTLLHFALSNESTPIELIRYLIQQGTSHAAAAAAAAVAAASAAADLRRRTPKHFLLFKDKNYLTPLHAACSDENRFPNSFERVQLIHQSYPDAIFSLTDRRSGEMPLHLACSNHLVEKYSAQIIAIVKYLVDHWPLALLIKRFKDGFMLTPLNTLKAWGEDHFYPEQDGVAELITFLSQRTQSMEQQLLQAALHNKFSEDSSSSNSNPSCHLSRRDWTILLENKFLQDRLSCSSFMQGVARMNQAGRFQALATSTASTNTATSSNNNKSNDHCQQATSRGVVVCAAVWDNVDCLFLHTKENPVLCQRRQQRKLTTTPDVS